MSQILHGTYLGLSSSYFTEETSISLSVLHSPQLLPHPRRQSPPQPWIQRTPAYSVFCTMYSPSPLCIFNFWSPRGLLFSCSSTCSSLPQFVKPSLDPPILLPFPPCSDTLNDVSPSLDFLTSPCPVNSPLPGRLLLNSRTLLLLQSSVTFSAFNSQVPSFSPS